MKIIVFGASGSGTTTLGAALANALGGVHLDADDYYWEQTDPPFQKKVSMEDKNRNLKLDFQQSDTVVVSGSLVSWGSSWRTAFDWGVFLWIPKEVRMQRLQIRERERMGSRLDEDPEVRAGSEAFLEWASRYDEPDFQGRSYRLHVVWLEQLSCPVVRLEGDLTTDQRVQAVLAAMDR